MKHPLNEIKRLQQLAGLNEWKIQPKASINPDTLDLYGHYNVDNNIYMYHQGLWSDWMEANFPGYQNDMEKEKKGEDIFNNEVRKAIKAKYGREGVKIHRYMVGLGEWKIQAPPRFRKGQTVYLWDVEDDHQVIGTVTDIVKGYDNVIEPVMVMHMTADSEDDDYYYELEFTLKNGTRSTVWASEPWMKREIENNANELNEWKIQVPPRFKKGQTVPLWDMNVDSSETGTVINIVKGANNIHSPAYGIYQTSENEDGDYYYELEFTLKNGTRRTIWASETLMKIIGEDNDDDR